MKKVILYFITTILLTSCMSHEVLYINSPQFLNPPVLENDSIRIEFFSQPFQSLNTNISITNKTNQPFHILWEEATIDSMEICFHAPYIYLDYLPEKLEPGKTITKKLSIKEYYGKVIPFFRELVIDAFGYQSRRIIIPIQFDNHRKDYYVELAMTKTKKKRLSEPPRFKEEN